jgi:adenosylhomocysteine nucleosidase
VVTGGGIAGVREKARLRASYGASAVDMEAAAVARIARAHGLEFRAVKAISDVAEFEMEELASFVTSDGQFRETGFAMYAAVRPWMWGRLIALGRNGARATAALAEALGAEAPD